MPFSSIVRIGLPTSVLMIGLGMATALSAQTSMNFSFNSTVTFPTFPPYPYTSDYVQCVAPAERQQEDNFVQLQRIYEQQKVMLVERRGQSRIEAWMIPERSARSRAIRDSDRAYRDAVRELDRWFRDQEKAIKRQFKDAEDICDDQFDTDVDSPDDGSSSSFSSRSSSSYASQPICGNGRCENGEGYYCPPCDTYGCVNSCAVGTCPQDCQSSSSSSRSSKFSSSSYKYSSSSSWIFYPTGQQQGIQSCSCETICDPSGSPCMAVCPAQC